MFSFLAKLIEQTKTKVSRSLENRLNTVTVNDTNATILYCASDKLGVYIIRANTLSPTFSILLLRVRVTNTSISIITIYASSTGPALHVDASCLRNNCMTWWHMSDTSEGVNAGREPNPRECWHNSCNDSYSFIPLIHLPRHSPIWIQYLLVVLSVGRKCKCMRNGTQADQCIHCLL